MKNPSANLIITHRSFLWAILDLALRPARGTVPICEACPLHGIDFNVGVTGFDRDELARFLAERDGERGLTDEDAVPELVQRR
jgi:hypothetical protein